jgi:hypothetical protein
MSYSQEKSVIMDGEEVRPLKPYGVGVDTHSKFIQVCVLVKEGNLIRQYENEFSTSWETLKNAGDWAREIIRQKSVPTVYPEILSYTIESTSTYHLPVLKAFGGRPSVVNPVLAGHTRRKTDVLDARLLAYQNMTGLWPESFVVSEEIQEFRLLMKQGQYHQRQCTGISNRINNYILRFGHTVGSLRSVVDIRNRALIEDICGEGFDFAEAAETDGGRFVCPAGIPGTAKEVIKKMYAEYDEHKAECDKYRARAMDYAKNIMWETENGLVKGEELIKNMLTIPYIGERAVLTWLAEVITPLRFPTPRHVSAYCGCDPSLKISAGKVTSQTRRKGNDKIHRQLVLSAGTCINHHKEPFGIWGYQLYKKHAKGGYKKACGAVARRLSVALYYIHLRNEPFSYEKYKFFKTDVPEVKADEMGLSQRVVNRLKENGLTDSKEVVNMLVSGQLFKLGGFGKQAVREINKWFQENKR